MEIAGARTLLTGATGGLGRAIAGALAARGAALLLSGRKADALEALAAELPGDGHLALPSDLAEAGAAEKLAAEAGDVDILVANAGLPGSGRLSGYSAEQLDRALQVNLEAPMHLTRALEPGMVERGRGHMVFVSSLSGKLPTAKASIYAATKFGLRGFAFGLRVDLDPQGIGVSIVSPGLIRDAGMYADTGAKPMPGVGTSSPQEVAAAVVKAIEQNKLEIAVAPLSQRVAAHFALVGPGLAVKMANGKMSRKMVDDVVSQQLDKR